MELRILFLLSASVNHGNMWGVVPTLESYELKYPVIVHANLIATMNQKRFIYILVFSSLWSLYEGMEFTMYTDTTSWISNRIFLRYYLLIMIGCFLVCCISYIVFHKYLGYNLPVPTLYIKNKLEFRNIDYFMNWHLPLFWYCIPISFRMISSYCIRNGKSHYFYSPNLQSI